MSLALRTGAIALLLLTACDGDPPAGTDAGTMMGTDAGTMMGTDAGPMMMGTDAGPMMMSDAGPPDMNAAMRARVAGTRARTVFCGCDMGSFATPAECVAFNQTAAADTCADMAFDTHFATVGSFFTCSASINEDLATCYEGASCDETALDACDTTADAAFADCPTVSDADAMAYSATLEACLDTMLVGGAGMCPDDSGAVMTTGAAVFTGSTVGAGSDLDAPAGCITVEGGGGSADMAFRWTAPSAGEFTFDSAGSSFDTVLYVLSGCDAAMSLGCNDDLSDTDLRSSVSATLTMGQEVLVVVEGFSTRDAGDFVININAAAP